MVQHFWAKPPLPRSQPSMFASSLDELIDPRDEIRHFEALLAGIDWAPWEARYERRRGQPPIHPSLVAGLILYGIVRGVRSSRKLEWASRKWIDLMWFLEGRSIDHTTICIFRELFNDLLPVLFDQLSLRASAAAGEAAGRHAAVDGTRVRASSDRQGARTARKLSERLEEMARNKQELLEEIARRDGLDNMEEALADSVDVDAAELRERLERYDAERAKLERALKVARERDAIKQAKNGAGATAVRVPVTDPESHLLPHKEGGYGPNWTPTVAVDVASGAIMDAGMVEGAEEATALLAAVETAERIYGRPPEALLADGNFAVGTALEQMEEAGVELLSPMAPTVDPVVAREDLNRPVGEDVRERLPMDGTGEGARLSGRAFVYDAGHDVYFCPQGRVLEKFGRKLSCDKRGRQIESGRYRCQDCSECPLAKSCLRGEAKRRTLVRDPYQPQRDRLAERMKQADARQLYRKRAPVVEGVFGYIKHVMGVRQFFYRGAAPVAGEWRWICAGFNVMKILRRAQGASGPAGGGHTRGGGESGRPFWSRTEVLAGVMRVRMWLVSILSEFAAAPAPQCG